MAEKSPRFECGFAPEPGKPRARGIHWKLPTVLILSFVAFTTLPLPLLGRFGSGEPTPWPPTLPPPSGELAWRDIPPSRTLKWYRCHENKYECARLDVPMDWIDPNDDDRVVLAVVRLPAVNKEDYRGPVFINPGGPGGSGSWALRDHGKQMQTVVGDNHDLISWDPRGVGASVPRIECWDSIQKRHVWDMQGVGTIDSHPGVLYDAYARALAKSEVCEKALNSSGILRHSSTVSHARDMLEIMHQLGEDKLKYWGFSYGTILGGTFAGMYPDKIDRLVSDGNVDYSEWYHATHINFIRDSDKIIDAFYELCHRAGPDECAFYAPSPAAVKTRLESLLENLRRKPVVIPWSDDGPEVPELVTYSKLRKYLSMTLYRPHYFFKPFAEVAAALERGDGRPFYNLLLAGTPPFSSLCAVETVPPTVPLPGFEEATEDAFPGIMCADGEVEDDSIEFFEKYVERLQEMSWSAGAVNVLFRISCVGRKVRPKWRFAGPFKANTSFPILFLANMADNVTPLISARNNSAGFSNSVVMIQNSYGHTSLSAPSTCTAKRIRAYFQSGTIPAPDTQCEPDELPFGIPAPGVQPHEESELSAAIHELSRRATWVGRNGLF